MKYKNDSLSIEERVEDLMGRMTLDEMAAQLGSYWIYQLDDGKNLSQEKAQRYLHDGIGQITRVCGGSSLKPDEAARMANQIQKYLVEETRLGIPAMIHEEACSGFTAIGATTFPQTIGVASSFDPELSEQIGKVIGRQMRAAGAHQALAPLLDVARDPRWGRMEETYGEDPYVVGTMGTAYVKGIQGDLKEQGVLATGKHFVGYGASEGGMNWAPVHLPERELREVYLTPFEMAVKEGSLASIMNGYHEIDGVPCGASKKLLNDILKEEWGFEGIVVSDYFAINQIFDYHNMAADKEEAAKMALEAGMDVELPNVDCFGGPLKRAVEKGDISMELIRTSVRKVLTFKFRLGLFEHPYVEAEKTLEQFDTPEDRQLALEAARKSVVLLKNENRLLPLSKDIKKLAVIGPSADNIRHMIGDYTYQGQIEGLLELHESQGNAMNQPIPENIEMSGNIVQMESYLEAIKKAVSSDTEIIYAKGCEIKGTSRDGFTEAVNAARQADTVLLFLGDLAGITLECTVGESVDRAELSLPGVQEELVRAIAATGVPVVLVLSNGRPYSITWEEEHIPAILEAWFPGEEGGKAVAEILFGDRNPGGKLPVSVPRTSGQIPVYYMHKKSGGRSHWRGNYDDVSASPLYAFGYGLSYTDFRFDDFKIEKKEIPVGGSLEASVKITNIGDREGDEVVQLYIRDVAACVTRPVQELKAYKRITLKPGESKVLEFTIKSAQMGFYDINMDYVLEPGTIEVMVGAASNDIRFRDNIILTGKKCKADRVFENQVIVRKQV